MSTVATPDAPEPPEGSRGAGEFPCSHRGRPGQFDEQARRLSHEELAVARQLAAEGHDVRALPETAWLGPRADLEVCGHAVEVKSFLPRSDRVAPPRGTSVCNKLLRASHQADVAIIWARGSGLREDQAGAGLRLFAGKDASVAMTSVRVIGDGFDLSWGTPLRTLDPRGVARSARRGQRPLEPRATDPPGRDADRGIGL